MFHVELNICCLSPGVQGLFLQLAHGRVLLQELVVWLLFKSLWFIMCCLPIEGQVAAVKHWDQS